MMKMLSTSLTLLLLAPLTWGFAPSSSFLNTQSSQFSASSLYNNRKHRLEMALSTGDRVMLVGPSFLQLNIAKAAKIAGLKPMIIADKKKLEMFTNYVQDDEIMADATYGMPEVGEPGFGEISGVVFCAEEAVLGPNIISAVLDYTDKGQSIFKDGAPKRVVTCAPVSGREGKEKSMGWMPIMGNKQKQEEQTWNSFVEAYQKHPSSKSPVGSVLRFGFLLGGSVDGPEILKPFGLDERIYKMSLEQYRDLRERAFDRFRLGAQVLEGNTINPQPPNQKKMEKEGIANDEGRECFKIVNGYPEIDRANRHTVAQAVVQSLLRPAGEGGVPQEMTILSKSVQQFPTDEEWDEMFANPGPARWPDPYEFDMSKYENAFETEQQ